MAKGVKKKGIKARKRQEDVEPFVSADEGEVSGFSNIVEDVDGSANDTMIPIRRSKRFSKKTRNRPPLTVMPSGIIPGALEELNLASGEQRRTPINRYDGSPAMNANGDSGAMQRDTDDARHSILDRGWARIQTIRGGFGGLKNLKVRKWPKVKWRCIETG